jgi:type IX secretion system PorP/SprF family membrane protein
MKSSILMALIFAFGSFCAKAQDFTFSQFYEKPLLRNPALAGISNADIRVNAAHRSQWGSVTIPYQTSALSVETRFPIGQKDDFLTAGLQITQDLAGDSKLGRIQILPALTFHKSIGQENTYLSFSVMGGMVQSQFDPSKMTFDDQFQNGVYNPTNATQQIFSKTNLGYSDVSTGLSFVSNYGDDFNYYVGVAGFHLVRSKVTFFDKDNFVLKPRYVVNAGINIMAGENDHIYFYGDYVVQAGNRQFLLGSLFRTNLVPDEDMDDEMNDVALSVGGSLRWADAFIPILKLERKKIFVGVSYDINLSKLKSASQFRGGLEITAGYKSYLNMRGGYSNGRDRGFGRRGGIISTKCPRF